MGWVGEWGGVMITYLLDRLDGLGGGMVTYLGLAYILPIQVGWVGRLGGWGGLGGMITYLGLAYILPYSIQIRFQ